MCYVDLTCKLLSVSKKKFFFFNLRAVKYSAKLQADYFSCDENKSDKLSMFVCNLIVYLLLNN